MIPPIFFETLSSDFNALKKAYSVPPTDKADKDKLVLTGIRFGSGVLMVCGGLRIVSILFYDSTAWDLIRTVVAYTLGHDCFLISNKVVGIMRKFDRIDQVTDSLLEVMKRIFEIVLPDNADQTIYVYRKAAENLAENTFLPIWINSSQFWLKPLAQRFLYNL